MSNVNTLNLSNDIIYSDEVERKGRKDETGQMTCHTEREMERNCV